MKLIPIVTFFMLALVVVSCGGSVKNKESEASTSEAVSFKNEEKIEGKIAEIDLNDSLLQVGSLYYTKEDGSSYEVNAFLDEKKTICKMEESFVVGGKGQTNSTIFYFDGGKKIATNEHFEHLKGKKPMFVERITYYDSNESPIASKAREAVYEELLDQALFSKVPTVNVSTANAKNALNQEGSFETTFQGFVENGQQLFLTIGEHKKDGYVSALLVQYRDANIHKLQSNELVMLGKKLRVNFEKMTDQAGFEFQILTGITFIED